MILGGMGTYLALKEKRKKKRSIFMKKGYQKDLK